jgi:hypothetical protein
VEQLTLKACPTCGSDSLTPMMRTTFTSARAEIGTIASSDVIACSCENGHIFMLSRTQLQSKQP